MAKAQGPAHWLADGRDEAHLDSQGISGEAMEALRRTLACFRAPNDTGREVLVERDPNTGEVTRYVADP